jgi:hypothetical protein
MDQEKRSIDSTNVQALALEKPPPGLGRRRSFQPGVGRRRSSNTATLQSVAIPGIPFVKNCIFLK